MRTSRALAWASTLCILIFFFTACGEVEQKVNMEKLKSQPKTYVTSETCKSCHLEHYDSWKATSHSRMAQDVRVNEDAFIMKFDQKKIRADFAKLEEKGKLKLPLKDIYIPEKKEVIYTIGSNWKQRFIIKKNGILYISPLQYNVETDRWVNYHENDWEKRPWLLKCGGCHTTGVQLNTEDMAKSTFTEPGVGCEGCHGPGSWHVALPKTAVFEKRNTIVNPAKLARGPAVQVCGSCHNRGKSTQVKGAGYPFGYMPGKALGVYYQSTSFAAGDTKHVYANEYSKGHHQQYIDWLQSAHAREGVTCTSCHYAHQLGMSSTGFQTRSSGSQTCFNCHSMVNNNMAHAIHSFANCVGCHMPRIAKSAESGDIHSHVFNCLLPQDTLNNPAIPNSCQACHKHKDTDLKELHNRFTELSKMPKPRGEVVKTVVEQ